ncbi:hypothetical protein Tco_1380810 [Tanacetum coccineum]
MRETESLNYGMNFDPYLYLTLYLKQKDMTNLNHKWLRCLLKPYSGISGSIDDVARLFVNVRELEKDAVTLLKRIRKFFMTQDIETRVAVLNRIGFAVAKRMALWQSQMEDHTSDRLRVVPISGLGQTMNGSLRRIFIETMLLVSGISAGKEFDIGLGGGRDKLLRPADMLLYSWDRGLDVCVDVTGSSPLANWDD